MRTTYRPALPIAAMLMLPLAATAQENNSGDVTVTAPRDKAALARWTAWVARSIDDNLAYPTIMGPSNPPQGLVDVAFKCSENGQPSSVVVYHSSGSQFLDRAALRAVQRVKTLHPLPDGMSHDQLYRARLMFLVGDGIDTPRRIASMQREADDANGRLWERAGQQSIAANAILIPAAALR